ncbi:hypothetical protein [Gryllotalpicola protaetiae]|uniref:Uncharacterized protein n=1 Tax=Gryllotalpicola protaetiae TaxID=2419771 RepID=A0A387BN14_9MICO|nr:hypothetical protein [Gryllotalpicola protaetiae]AYG03414.1 hypothetical protein D7I44_07615 [Gryllotalpicola protaetiae]
MTVVPRAKPFRFGVARGARGEFKPICTIGMIRDGGIFVSPAKLANARWTYGLTPRYLLDRETDLVTVDERPKLHYHQSGIASVTLTGTSLERRHLRLNPITEIRRSAVISVVANRIWDLPTDPKGARNGDLMSLERLWPQVVGLTLSVVTVTDEQAARLHLFDASAFGLIPGDRRSFLVSLAGFGHHAVLVGRFRLDMEPWPEPITSITVGATPWSPEGPQRGDRALALFTEGLRNPIFNLAVEDDVPSVESLPGLPDATVGNFTWAERIRLRAEQDEAGRRARETSMIFGRGARFPSV